MAEIKSTLDLVMERTRDLTMTEDDRRRQSEAELRDGAGRLVQHYVEGLIGVDKFMEELGRLEKSHGREAAKAAICEIAKRIDPDSEYGPFVVLLRDGFGKNVAGIETLIRNYRLQTGVEIAKTAQEMLEKLRGAGISGSAVVPNAACNEGLTAKLGELLERFKRDLHAAVSGLQG